MSIINDALKKTQQNLNPTTDAKAKDQSAAPPSESQPQLGDERFARPAGLTPSAGTANFSNPPPPQPSYAPLPSAAKPATGSKKVQPNRTGQLLLVLVIAAGFFAYQQGYFKKTALKLPDFPFLQKEKKNGTKRSSSRPLMRQAPAKAAVPQNPGELTLNGITDLGEKVVALINNQIYEVGDSVLGMKIIAIEKNAVQLEGNGITKVLKIDNAQ